MCWFLLKIIINNYIIGSIGVFAVGKLFSFYVIFYLTNGNS